MKRKSDADLVDKIQEMAQREYDALHELSQQPDSRMTSETIMRLNMLLEVITKAKKEQRDQLKFLLSLSPEERKELEGRV